MELSDWVLKNLFLSIMVYFTSLMCLGAGFWTSSLFTVIASVSIISDFCRNYCISFGGVLFSVAILKITGLGHEWLIDVYNAAKAGAG